MTRDIKAIVAKVNLIVALIFLTVTAYAQDSVASLVDITEWKATDQN